MESTDPSAYAEGFRAGELAALEEFSERFKTELARIQSGMLGRPRYTVADDIAIAAGTIIKEMRNERE